MAGEEFFVVKDEKKAKTLSALKADETRAIRLRASKRVTLEDFYSKMKEGVTKELNILLKGDVQGSVEALKASLNDMSASDVKVNIIHADVGGINESDVMLAVVANAVVIGFNVKPDPGADALAAKEGIEIKLYGVIYEAIQDVFGSYGRSSGARVKRDLCRTCPGEAGLYGHQGGNDRGLHCQ